MLLTAAAAGSLVLLAFHPSEGGATFAEVLRSQAASRAESAIVHGGFAALLIIEVMALAILVLQARRPPSIAGTVLFAFGAIALSGSQITDGILLPTVAAKYAALSADIEFAKALFTLCWAIIGVLMPAGLILLSAGVVFWGIGLAHDRHTRINGFIGIASGLGAAVSVGVLRLQPLTIMGAIVGLNSWLLFLGITAVRGKLYA
jgi:hypothetical protein